MAQGFFDVHAKLHRRNGTGSDKNAPPNAALGPTSDNVLSVSQLTSQIDRALKTSLPASFLVKGEVSNYKAHGGSGHSYFTLKDSGACIDSVMFRADAATLRFRPEDGMELLATGRVAVYAQRGKYQFYVTSLVPIGQGALELALQQVRSRLEKEGLFASERKRPLPRYPARLVLVTSRATAALQDMLKVLRRFPWLKFSIYHVPVQGDGAAEKIAEAIDHVNAHRERLGIDLILLARGGGSLEDLWEFNEEVLARAICASAVPIVTGIGHEIDTSIADLCADYFAHTPTEAAQVVTQQWRLAHDELEAAATRLRRGFRAVVQDGRQRLTAIERHEFFRRPFDRVDQLRQILDDRQRELALGMSEQLRLGQRAVGELNERLQRHRPQDLLSRHRRRITELQHALAGGLVRQVRLVRERLLHVLVRLRERHPKHQVDLQHQRLEAVEARLQRAAEQHLARRQLAVTGLEAQLNALSPERVLRRGYTITILRKTGAVIRDPGELRPGDRLITRFADGEADSVVQDTQQLSLFE